MVSSLVHVPATSEVSGLRGEGLSDRRVHVVFFQMRDEPVTGEWVYVNEGRNVGAT